MVNSQNLKASVSFVGDGTTNKFYFGFDYINNGPMSSLSTN